MKFERVVVEKCQLMQKNSILPCQQLIVDNSKVSFIVGIVSKGTGAVSVEN